MSSQQFWIKDENSIRRNNNRVYIQLIFLRKSRFTSWKINLKANEWSWPENRLFYDCFIIKIGVNKGLGASKPSPFVKIT